MKGNLNKKKLTISDEVFKFIWKLNIVNFNAAGLGQVTGAWGRGGGAATCEVSTCLEAPTSFFLPWPPHLLSLFIIVIIYWAVCCLPHVISFSFTVVICKFIKNWIYFTSKSLNQKSRSSHMITTFSLIGRCWIIFSALLLFFRVSSSLA